MIRWRPDKLPIRFWFNRLHNEHRGFYAVLEICGVSFDLTVSWRA